MKKQLTLLLTLPAALLLTQCAELNEEIEREDREAAREMRQNNHHKNHHHANRNANTNTDSHPTYGVGFAKGRQDGMKGLSRTPDRYSSIYSEADRGQFFSGYEAGYNIGIQ